MNPKTLATIVIAALVLFGGAAFLVSRPNSTNPAQSTESKPSLSDGQPQTAENQQPLDDRSVVSYTASDVAEHNQPDDCWTIIDKTVYDITSYLPRHPGGDNILSACGVDGTAFFKGQLPGQSGGVNNHGSAAKSQLDRLKIGTLAD
jgi:hypothetical protein